MSTLKGLLNNSGTSRDAEMPLGLVRDIIENGGVFEVKRGVKGLLEGNREET